MTLQLTTITCPRCQSVWNLVARSDGSAAKRCPTCGQTLKPRGVFDDVTCTYCGNTWTPRKLFPQQCPECHCRWPLKPRTPEQRRKLPEAAATT